MKNLWLRLSCVCLGLWAAGCIAGAAPQIDQVYPNQNQVSVDATIRSLSVIYNAGLDSSSVQPDTIELHEMDGTTLGPALAGTTDYDPTYLTLSFVLDSAASLQPNTTYQATVNDGLKASDGLSFDSSYSWTFTTGGTK